MKIERGLILSADGQELATNRKEGQYYLREYPLGDLVAPWLGYNNLRYGRAGIERVYNEELTGQSGLLGVTGSWSQMLGQSQRGADLKLTIDMGVQRAAAKALGERKGAVVALDPRTGAVLAMVSYPALRPQRARASSGRPSSPIPTGLFSTGPPRASTRLGRCSRSSSPRPGCRPAPSPRRPSSTTRGPSRSGATWCTTTATRCTGSTLRQGLRQQHQHHLRHGGGAIWAPTRWPATPPTSGSASRFPGGWAGRRARFPDPGRHGHGPRGPGVHRSGRGPRHSPADGPGRLGGGQRRQDHEALHRRPGAQLQRGHRREDLARGLAAAHHRRHSGHHDATSWSRW